MRKVSAAAGDGPLTVEVAAWPVEGCACTQTPVAAHRGELDPAMNLRLYNNTDIHTADNSPAGQVTPGNVGANPIPETLVSWMLARTGRHGVRVPGFSTHVTCEPLARTP